MNATGLMGVNSVGPSSEEVGDGEETELGETRGTSQFGVTYDCSLRPERVLVLGNARGELEALTLQKTQDS